MGLSFLSILLLCLMIGAFSPFTFKVIIEKYVLIAIAGFKFVVTKGSRLASLLSYCLTYVIILSYYKHGLMILYLPLFLFLLLHSSYVRCFTLCSFVFPLPAFVGG